MKILGNIIWLIFGGLEMALGYLFFGFLLCLTIIGIPFGWQVICLAGLALWPFGKNVRDKESASGCLPLLMNVLWIVLGGFWLAVGHAFLGLVLCITIIGIPFGMQHFKLAFLILAPFGKEVVSTSQV
ncbi:MAG: YccF domain-containing protein [Bacteroidaceae bacterium]|nr:YccF domain-containing protein [Bacteroidaceae bacterium]